MKNFSNYLTISLTLILSVTQNAYSVSPPPALPAHDSATTAGNTAGVDQLKKGDQKIYDSLVSSFSAELGKYIQSTGKKDVDFYKSITEQDQKKIDALKLELYRSLATYSWDTKQLQELYSGSVGAAFLSGSPSALLASEAVAKLIPFEHSLATMTKFLKDSKDGKLSGDYGGLEQKMGLVALEAFVRNHKEALAQRYNEAGVKDFRNLMATHYMGYKARGESGYAMSPGTALRLASFYGDSRALDTAEAMVKEVADNPDRASASSGDWFSRFSSLWSGGKRPLHDMENNVPDAVNAIADFQNGSSESMTKAQNLKTSLIDQKEHLKKMIK